MCFHVAFPQLSAAKYTINNIGVNTKHSDYGVSYFGPNRVVFASSIIDGQSLRNKFKSRKDDLPRYDLFQGFVNLSGEITDVKILENNFVTKYNESNVSFTPDLKYVYFTQNNNRGGKYIKNKSEWINLMIYRAAVKSNGEWTNIVSLSFNNDNYSCAHPSVSEDGKILFFTSDMPGSYGRSDIYWVIISEDGTYGEPQNLGRHVNSSAKENFPYVNGNILYFSSNKADSNGGLDIYMVALDEPYSKPVNLGSSINSPFDDFCFVLDRKNKTGFFSSNRAQGKGKDDIYFFTQDTEIQDCKQVITGEVRDKKTDEIIPDATVSIYSHKNILLATLPVDREGKFQFELACRANYRLVARNPKYNKVFKNIGFTPDIFSQNIKLYLDRIPQPVVAVEDKEANNAEENITTKENEELQETKTLTIEDYITLNKKGREVLDIEPIYFELDEFYISQDASQTLSQVAHIINEYESIVVECGSHTDSRASSSYNLHLSNLRAKEVIDHLTSLGVNPDRIKSRGYGEAVLVNKCRDNVHCAEAEHLQNRRTEFIVLNK